MSKLIVTGGRKLEGNISLSGNKNSVLKLIPAVLLADSPSTLTNVPDILDVSVVLQLIETLGAKVTRDGHSVTIDPSGLHSFDLDPDLSAKFRASVVLAAPLLVKFGKAIVTPPGGDQIGDRFLDTHFSMMQKMGVEMRREDGRFFLTWNKKKTGTLFLEEASVTATEMALMMATSSPDITVVENAATEPHVTDLGKLLIKMGAKITGLGLSTLSISGGKLKGVEYRVMPDHIEGGTFVIASAITGGHIKIDDFIPEDHRMALINLANMGVKFELSKNSIEVFPSKLVATRKKFKAQPWPGFPTDLMSPFIVLATQTQGTVLCHDWMYEWRMFFVDDLISMGANIFIADPHRVIVSGPTPLMSDRLFCKDIRAGISVILAALIADGRSEIENIEVVQRGYERIDERLRSLGAEIVTK
ncbi:MAG: UDP-N-acetylglucosamine 1-carboxyvinyltransferase [Candidatus Woesebacteria bacterium]|nr:MAG: UDP-N-acetylglucosamine 1-carboxyvinyltransferase [Candidatus Woesebacteria bacterium]